MVSDHLYHRGVKYWLYASYVDKKKATATDKHLKKKYKTSTLLISTDSFFGSYPIYHLYANKVRNLWS